ncbi:MAG: OmpA family protein [Prevotella sp.]|nr:OmpA family protein [Prevotella sp.]
MKKVGLLLCFGLAVIASSFAQENKKAFASNGFWDNWFIGAGAKGSVYVNGALGDVDLLSTPSLGGELYVGKWFSPNLGARLTLEGGALHPFYDGPIMGHQEYASAHAEVLFNATNFLCGYNPSRFYNFIPYLGVGLSHGFKDDWKEWENNAISFAGGLLNTFRLSEKVGIYLDIRGLTVDDEFDGTGKSGDVNWEGIASASLGLTYKFGSSGSAATRFLEVDGCDQSLIDGLNDQINKLRAENDQLRKRPVSCPEVKPCPPATATTGDVVVPNVVFFRLNSANIDKNQEISIYNTAEYLKANESAKVKIIGYADAKTGTADYNYKLSEKRAKNVAKALIEKYNIASDRVTVEWKGSSEQPYKENAWNRVAIFFAE